MQKTLSENQSKDVSKLECNIVHKKLSHNNSVDAPDNVITELKDNEHKESSVTQKVTSYFNIFEFGRNLLDQLDVTYQQAFMVTSSQDEYYRDMTKILIKANIGNDVKICNEKIHRAVIALRSELDL